MLSLEPTTPKWVSEPQSGPVIWKKQTELLGIELQVGHDRHAGEPDHDLVGEVDQHAQEQEKCDSPGPFRRRLAAHGLSLACFARRRERRSGDAIQGGAHSATGSAGTAS